MNDSKPTMAIICPECGSQTEVESRLVGRKGKCADCNHKFMIERNDVKKEKEETIRAACPACDFGVEVSHEMKGRKGQCPSCDHKFIIDTSTSSKGSKRKQKKSKRDSKNEVDGLDQSDEEISGESKRQLLRGPIVLSAVLLLLMGFVWYSTPHDNKNGKEDLKPQVARLTEPTPVEETPVAVAIPEVEPIELPVSVESDQTISPSVIPPLKEPVPMKENKIEILSIAENSEYFMVHSSSASDEELAEISPQAGRIVWLNLNQSTISDASLPLIAEMSSLTRLQLKGCSISDVGLAHLTNHATLQTLFLNQCSEITDSSREVFESLPALRSLYIEGTQVTAESVALLREARPNLKIHH